jgi:hypothetical protein
MLKFLVALAVCAAATIPTAAAQARAFVVDISGTVYRYSGDTLWVDRDSTSTRTIYRGDSVYEEQSIHGRLRRGSVTQVRGDSARLVAVVDANGFARPVKASWTSARSLHTAKTRAERAKLTPRTETNVMFSHTAPVVHCVDFMTKIIQTADTAVYVRNASGRIDTTAYLLGRDTTVRRLRPNPQTFGLAMHAAIIRDMDRAISLKRTADRGRDSIANVSAISGWCNF